MYMREVILCNALGITEHIRERPTRRCATSSLCPGYAAVAKKQ